MNAPTSQEIETPCIKVCVIGGWLGMSSAERRDIMADLPERVGTLTLRKRRKGGRRGRLGLE